jgi:hypothetical protein
MRSLCACLTLLGMTGATCADEVFLKGGGRIDGAVVARSEVSITLETAPGRVTVPLSRVERVVESRGPLAAYRDRAAQLSTNDAPGWLKLGLWARDAGLATQSRQAFERALAIDPANVAAQEALGNVLVDGQWLSREEAFRRRGYALVDGRWVSPEELKGLIAQRQADVETERLRVEAETREKEAEARVREAEAQARAAEALARRDEEEGASRAAWASGRGGWPCCSPGHRRHDGQGERKASVRGAGSTRGSEPRPNAASPRPNPAPTPSSATAAPRGKAHPGPSPRDDTRH